MESFPKEKQIPMALNAVGTGIIVLSAIIKQGSSSISHALTVAMLGGAIQTVLLIAAAFLVAMMLKVSFGELNSAILKFCGITMFCWGLRLILPMGGFLNLFVFLGLVMWLFELEMPYVIALTVVQWVMGVVTLAILFQMFS